MDFDAPGMLQPSSFHLETCVETNEAWAIYFSKNETNNQSYLLKIANTPYDEKSYLHRQLMNEFLVAERLSTSHRLIVAEGGGFDDRGHVYLYYPYLPHASLSKFTPKTQNMWLMLAKSIAIAVAELHTLNIIHRDIKPTNILVNSEYWTYLIDFGLACGTGLHPLEGAVGTPHYISPECARGESPTFASDIYSIGVVLYELASGRVPFEADSAGELLRMHCNAAVPRLTATFDTTPKLADIIYTCMAKDPKDRYPNTDALYAALFEL